MDTGRHDRTTWAQCGPGPTGGTGRVPVVPALDASAALTQQVEIDLTEAFTGTKINLRVPTRIKCDACEGTGSEDKARGVETCTTCHSYIKHLHQHRAPALDPVADDIASYGLDLKIAEDGFRRAGLNLLFVI